MDLLNGVATTTFATDLSASVGSSINSVWFAVVIAAAIPLAFYIIYKLLALIPKGRNK